MLTGLAVGMFLATGCVSPGKHSAKSSEYASDASSQGSSNAPLPMSNPVIQTVKLVPSTTMGTYTLKVLGNEPLACTAIKQAFP